MGLLTKRLWHIHEDRTQGYLLYSILCLPALCMYIFLFVCAMMQYGYIYIGCIYMDKFSIGICQKKNRPSHPEKYFRWNVALKLCVDFVVNVVGVFIPLWNIKRMNFRRANKKQINKKKRYPTNIKLSISLCTEIFLYKFVQHEQTEIRI